MVWNDAVRALHVQSCHVAIGTKLISPAPRDVWHACWSRPVLSQVDFGQGVEICNSSVYCAEELSKVFSCKPRVAQSIVLHALLPCTLFLTEVLLREDLRQVELVGLLKMLPVYPLAPNPPRAGGLRTLTRIHPPASLIFPFHYFSPLKENLGQVRLDEVFAYTAPPPPHLPTTTSLPISKTVSHRHAVWKKTKGRWGL